MTYLHISYVETLFVPSIRSPIADGGAESPARRSAWRKVHKDHQLLRWGSFPSSKWDDWEVNGWNTGTDLEFVSWYADLVFCLRSSWTPETNIVPEVSGMKFRSLQLATLQKDIVLKIRIRVLAARHERSWTTSRHIPSSGMTSSWLATSWRMKISTLSMFSRTFSMFHAWKARDFSLSM